MRCCSRVPLRHKAVLLVDRLAAHKEYFPVQIHPWSPKSYAGVPRRAACGRSSPKRARLVLIDTGKVKS